MNIKSFLSFSVFLLGMSVCSGVTPAQLYEKSQNNNHSVQTWYVKGVPHTDKNGARLSKYDPAKSFFPIGMWGAPMHDPAKGYDWAELQQLGCNTVWLYFNYPVNKNTLSVAGKFGLQMIFMGRRHSDAVLTDIANHPNLLGHVFYDEPTGKVGKKEVIENLYKEFIAFKSKYNKLSPSTAIFINDTPWIMPPATEWFVKWNTAGDVACHDNYPIKKAAGTASISENPNGLMQTTVLTVLANEEKKPAWVILGAFELGFLEGRDAFPARYPSADQLRSQVYTAIIHGATGIHYFIWDSWISRDGCVFGISSDPKVKPHGFIEKSPRSRPATPMQMVNAQALWNAVGKINAELKTLIPVILSPTVDPAKLSYSITSSATQKTPVSTQPVHGMLKKVPGEDAYILLNANMDTEVLDTTFCFDREVATAEVLFGTYPLPVKIAANGRRFTLRYEPFQAHILKLTFKKDSPVIPVRSTPESGRIIEIPLEKARLWAVGKSTAKLYHNPASRETTITQPVVKGEEPWSIQWNKLNYPGIKNGRSYELYLNIKSEGDSGNGAVLTVGCYNSKMKRSVLNRVIQVKDLLPGNFGWVKAGVVKVDDPMALNIYLAPHKNSVSQSYHIKGVELRLIDDGNAAAAGKKIIPVVRQKVSHRESVKFTAAKARLWAAGKATPKLIDDDGHKVILQPLQKGSAPWSVQWNNLALSGIESGKKYDIGLELKADSTPNVTPLLTFGIWDKKQKRTVFSKVINSNDAGSSTFRQVKIGILDLNGIDPANLSIYLAPHKNSNATGYRVAQIEFFIPENGKKTLPSAAASGNAVIFPLKKARLWAAGDATPRLVDENGIPAICQPVRKNKESWWIQWNKLIYPGIETGKTYSVYLTVKFTGKLSSGPLFAIGIWDKKKKSTVFRRRVDLNSLRAGEYIRIKAGSFKIAADPADLSIYIAPDKAGNGEAYFIRTIEFIPEESTAAEAAVLSPSAVEYSRRQMAVKGIVFHDRNGNGKIDHGENGIANIQVSDGVNIAITGHDGTYSIPDADGKFIFAAKPGNGVFTGSFYHAVAPVVNFGVKLLPEKEKVTFFSVNDTECGNALGFIDQVAVASAEKGGDFLVHCGDIGNMAGHKETMIQAGLPVYYVLGNHDFKKKGDGGEAEFEKNFGPVYYSFNYGGLHFIVLAHYRYPDAPPSKDIEVRQLRWLKRDLALNPGKKIVFRHHPLRFYDQFSELLKKPENNVIAVFSGHTHATQSRIIGKIINVESAPPTCGGIDHSPKGFVCGVWQNGNLTVRHINSWCFRPGIAVDPTALPVRLSGSWAQFRRAANRDGLADKAIKMPLKLRWKTALPGKISASSPVICNNKVFIATLDDAAAKKAAVCALDAIDGRLIWQTVVGASVKHTVACDGKRVYGACVDGTAFALDAENGKVLWQTPIAYYQKNEGVYGCATVRDGRVWIGGDHIVELDPESGRILREDDKPDGGAPSYCAPVFDGNRVYSNENWRQGIYAHDLNLGKRLWRTGRIKGGGYTFLDSGPFFANGRVYQKLRYGIRALNPANGFCMQEFVYAKGRQTMESFSLPLFFDKKLFVGSAHGVFAHDADTLELLWKFVPQREMRSAIPYERKPLPAVYSSFALMPGGLIFGGGDGFLYVLDPGNGKKLYAADLGSPVYSSPAVSGNTVIIASGDGVVYALTGKN